MRFCRGKIADRDIMDEMRFDIMLGGFGLVNAFVFCCYRWGIYSVVQSSRVDGFERNSRMFNGL